MTKVQRYKVGYYTDEWGMSSNTPCLVPDDSGYAVKFEDYCKLETEIALLQYELEAALKVARDTIKYYSSVCGEDDQPTPAKETLAKINEVLKP